MTAAPANPDLASGEPPPRRRGRLVLGLIFVAAGAAHFAVPGVYERVVPPYLPWPRELVYVSGAAEVALGLLVLARQAARVAAWGLIALLVAVFPANVHMATHPDDFPRFPPAALWTRLPFQAVLIGWAYRYTRTP
jgi:uncharacterized membrane protein